MLGLEIGGDDYVTKPFSPRELVARINVILKRTRSRPPQDEVRALVRGPLVLDLVGYRVTFDDKPVTLTALEFAIMKVFAARPNQVFNRDQILDAAYAGTVHVSDRTIDSHIRNIRSKLSQAGCDQAIETVHGIGFRLGSCEIS